MRFVATKTLDQQSYLMLHAPAICSFVNRPQVINAIRGHLAEFGIVAPVGRNGVEHLLNISSPIAVTDGYPAGLRSVVCGLSQVHEPTDHCLVRLSSGRNGIKPMQTTKPRKITVCRVQRKPVLHSQCSQVSV
jgi:hypothetical protein